MFCSISGTTPEEPVVSRVSGLLYERRLIEKFIAENGCDPVTKDALTMQDLIYIKSNKAVKPRPLQAASIPGMLGLFQNEWDAVMLSNHQLEQQLHTARQELSHALYQHDAACRVIARLKKERDEARLLLAQAERQPYIAPSEEPAPISNGKRGPEEEVAPQTTAKAAKQGITEEIIKELVDCCTNLSAMRKKRQISETLTSMDTIREFTQLSSHPLAKTAKPGILSTDIHAKKELIVTGNVDSNVVVFDRKAGQIKATLTGHSKKVMSVKFVQTENVVVSASADKTIRLWRETEDGDYNCEHVIRSHTGEVRAVALHATNKYFVSAAADKSWALFELSTGNCLTMVQDESVAEGFTSAAFHPDGLILGTGTADSLIRIWDVKSQANVAKFEGHTGSISDISFSENGYFLATAGQDGVKLWDLRKLRNFRSFAPYDAATPFTSVEFDYSGSYLVTGGAEIRVYATASVKAEWNIVKEFPDLSGTGKITSVRFGPDAEYLTVASMDRNLRIFGAPAKMMEED